MTRAGGRLMPCDKSLDDDTVNGNELLCVCVCFLFVYRTVYVCTSYHSILGLTALFVLVGHG